MGLKRSQMDKLYRISNAVTAHSVFQTGMHSGNIGLAYVKEWENAMSTNVSKEKSEWI